MVVPPKYNFRAANVLETGRTTANHINTLKQWIDENPKIPELSDEQIVVFLLACNNEEGATIRTIQAYFHYKSSAPELHLDRSMEQHQDLDRATEIVDFSVGCGQYGTAILICRLKDTNYRHMDVDILTKLLFMCVDLTLLQQMATPPTALITILDMRGFGLMHLTRLRLDFLRKFFHYVQEALPIQLRSVHLINTVWFFDKVLALIRPFMKTELFDLMTLHSGQYRPEQLLQDPAISLDSLPQDYGGRRDLQEICTQRTFAQLRQYSGHFIMEDEQIRMYRNLNNTDDDDDDDGSTAH